MQIQIPSELVAKLNQSLKSSNFKDTEELIKYLLEQYLVFYDNDDDMIEFIETYTETYHEMKQVVSILDEEIDITYVVEDYE